MPSAQRSWEAPAAVCPTCGEPYWDTSITHCRHDGAALVTGGTTPTTMVERVVGQKYRLLGLIGEGGMGTVYAAEHSVSLERVALKIIKPELESSAVARGRFLRECALLQRIDSPYVVQVIDSGQSKLGEIFLIMELLEGKTLGEKLEEVGSLTPAEAVRVAIQIAHALAAAHAEGIVHRDLKPDNVFLCDDGSVRVLDFGIARLLDGVTLDADSRKLTATGTIVGTPAYISPEGAAGAFIGPAADLYSLGVLLYEMMTGELPFWDSHPVLLMGMHLKEPAPRLDEQSRGIPKNLVDLVDQLLEKEPEKRPPGADVVLDRLETMQREDGAALMGASDTLPVDRPPPSPHPNRLVLGVALASVAFLGLVGLGALAYNGLGSEPVEAELTAEPTVRAPSPEPIGAVTPPEGVDAPAAPTEGSASSQTAESAEESEGDEPPEATGEAADEGTVDDEGEAEAGDAEEAEAEAEPDDAPAAGRRRGRPQGRSTRRRARPGGNSSRSAGQGRRRNPNGTGGMIRDYW